LLENLIHDSSFGSVMRKNIQELIVHLFEKDINFGILCNIEDIEFTPPLPEDIVSQFHTMTLFFLAGYTFETARIEGDELIFEAGFGSDNFGSVVNVPLLSIVQVIIDEQPILINLAKYKKEEPSVIQDEEVVDPQGVENSMSIFLSNPENSKFLK